MKVLILGGCGHMGSSTARELIKYEEVTHITLADIEVDLAKTHESVRSSKKVSTLVLDVADFETLVTTLKGNDVVINDSAPYSKLGVSTVKAAIEAGVNYIDICDDCRVTRKMFELDESAKKANVSICTGFGGSPGITNVLAKYGADKLDEVDEIRVYWGVALSDPFGATGRTQALGQFMGNVIQYIDGKWVEVPSGSGSEEVMFLEPVGKSEVYYALHSEAVTLPRFIPMVKTVIEKGGFLPSWVSKLFMEFIRLGVVNDEELTVSNVSLTAREMMSLLMGKASGFWEQVAQYSLSPGTVVVKGKEGGKGVTYSYRFAGKGAAGIAILSSMCALMLYRGDIQKKGILAPEGVADPKEFLRELVKRGAHFIEEKIVEQEVKF